MLKEKIDFREGLVYFKNLQFFLFSLNSILCLIDKIFENEKIDKIYDILDKISKEDSFLMYKNSQKIKGNKDKILYFLNFINSIGIGEIKIKVLTKDKIIFKMEECILSKAYFRIFNKNPLIEIEQINSFFIKNFLECLFNKEIEHKVKKSNKKGLIFSYSITSRNKNICFKKEKYNVNNKRNINDLLKKIIINKQIIIKDGYFNLLGSYAIIFPIYFIFNIYNNLEPKKYSQYLPDLGYVQGVCAVDFLKQKYGIDKKKLFNIIYQQSEIVGVGKINVVKLDPFKFQANNNLDSYYKYFSNPNMEMFNFYFYNVFKGAYDVILNTKSQIIKNEFIIFEKTDKKFNLTKQQKLIYKHLKLRLFIK